MTQASRDPVSSSWVGGTAVVAALVLWMLRDLVVLVGLSLLLAYALDPAVTALERLKLRGRALQRGAASFVVMLLVGSALTVAAILGVPVLAQELVRFAEGLPATLTRLVENFRAYGAANGFGPLADQATQGAIDGVTELASNLAGTVVGGAGRIVSGLGALLGAALVPLLAFYLLAERAGVRASVLRFVPGSERPRFDRLARAIDPALRSYVRGQALVCLIVGVVTGVALAAFGHPYAILLAVIVGLVEVVPYVGFIVAAVAIAVAGITQSPQQALIGIIVYVVVNSAVSYLITPRVMGKHLKMHPFVITVSILAGAQLLGAGGALLALPFAAIVQSVVGAWSADPAGRRDH